MPFMQFMVSFQPRAACGSKGKQALKAGAAKETAVAVELDSITEDEWPEVEDDLEDYDVPKKAQLPAATQKKRRRLVKLSDSRQQKGAEGPPADAVGSSSREQNRVRKLPSKLRD